MPICLFLSKTLQEMEIHSSVVLLEPVLQNLMNTDQTLLLRYVENLLPRLQLLSYFASNCRKLTVSAAFFLYKYVFIIHIYTPILKMLQFENMILFVFSLKRCWQKIIGTMVFFLWCEIYMYLPDQLKWGELFLWSTGVGRVGFELVCLYFERGFLAYFDEVLFCLTDCQVYALPLLSQWA